MELLPFVAGEERLFGEPAQIDHGAIACLGRGLGAAVSCGQATDECGEFGGIVRRSRIPLEVLQDFDEGRVLMWRPHEHGSRRPDRVAQRAHEFEIGVPAR